MKLMIVDDDGTVVDSEEIDREDLENVAESATEIDPSYPGYYLQAQALRPALAIVMGVILWAGAGRLGRRAARGLDEHDHE